VTVGLAYAGMLYILDAERRTLRPHAERGDENRDSRGTDECREVLNGLDAER
jgi:hypothetical protein